jgi:hypothetical protein
MRTRAALATAAASLVTLAAPSPASACWDGYAASAGNVHVAESQDEGAGPWSPELARDVGTWLVRTDTLLPAGITVDVDPGGYASVCRGSGTDPCATELGAFRWNGDMPALLRAVARSVRASPASQWRARAQPVTAWSVQVFAARDESRAERVADDLNQLQKLGGEFSCDEGFLSVGGFPSWNDCAHVADARGRDGKTFHRVLVGAFLDESEARAQLASIVTYTSLGGFVRAL